MTSGSGKQKGEIALAHRLIRVILLFVFLFFLALSLCAGNGNDGVIFSQTGYSDPWGVGALDWDSFYWNPNWLPVGSDERVVFITNS